jgi:hypothetical protein
MTHSTDGFTMIELLVGAIVAFLIIGPLLGFVVNILNDDSREQVKTTADYELQAAVDFISEDLSQAYYIYDPAQIVDIKTQLPAGDPILVFWKLYRIPNSIPIPGINNIVPRNCTPDTCNDTSVRAVVAYYLVDDDDQTWCQPAGDCPKRIVRHLAYEKLEKFRGTRVYYPEGDLKDSQKGTLDIPANFSLEENPTANFPTVPEDPQVLVNYISGFSLLPIDETSNPPIYIPDTNDSVKFTIQSNALRRIDGSKTGFCETPEGKDSAYCPKASVRVQGLRTKSQ